MRFTRNWLTGTFLLLLSAMMLRLALVPAAPVWATSLQPDLVHQPDDHIPADLACRLCHQDTEAQVTFPSGENLTAQVDLATLDHSAHGAAGEQLECTACHAPNRYRQPHTGSTAADYRQYQIENSASCVRCHGTPHPSSHEGVAPAEPICTDCHGAHEVTPVAAWSTTAVVERCTDCHETDEGERLGAITAAGLFDSEADESYCLACHSEAGPMLTFANDEAIAVQVDETDLRDSVHGAGNSWGAITCHNCHEQKTYPHAPVAAASSRVYSLAQSEKCAACHDHNFAQAQDSVHAVALADGNAEAAVCTDCHGAHDVPPAAEPRSRIPQTCRQCHSGIYDEYAGSVHAEALLEDENGDVPTCTDCHGVHNIGDPSANLFRIRSPQLCGGCHANQELMAQYDISTNVFDSYVADFHGTTVTLFEHLDPDVETNKAVCYDCHGVHQILAPDDPEAGIKRNLLTTCQQCHPDATEEFPDAWTSHFEPSPEHNPLVYIVEKFYEFIIPITLGGLGFLVVTDVYRRARSRTDRGGKDESS